MGVNLGALESKQINRVLKCCRRCADTLNDACCPVQKYIER